ncbi:MAG: AAA family ATPase [Clostridia bacterium]|nr:AAA family ATPase [Clostridia bacterium]
MAEKETQKAQEEQYTGSILRVIYKNEDTGYAVCDLGCEQNGPEVVTICGILPYIQEGDSVKLYGKWVLNPKYGRQIQVSSYEKLVPADIESILRYLSSRAIPGIGPKTARKIVDLFGKESFEVLENHPEFLSDIPGISLKKARQISAEFKQKEGFRTTLVFFQKYFGPAVIQRIYRQWGSGCVEIARHEPYRLCDEIDGIGFETADRFAREMGVAEDSEVRLKSGAKYCLSTVASQNGHTCLPRKKLLEVMKHLLNAPEGLADECIARCIGDGSLYAVAVEGETYLYLPSIYNSERMIARKLLLLDRKCAVIGVENAQVFVRDEEERNGIEYASEQKKAIYSSMESGVLILTGGPGTGKTTIVRALIHMFERMDYRVDLCAPTGRAAKRLSDSTGHEAMTVHRLLEYQGVNGEMQSMTNVLQGPRGEAHFNRDESHLLESDVVIVDEASMLDCQLTAALLAAIKPGARLIIIGDADQLPSVGAGNVLQDLIRSQCFSTICLTEVFRQARTSLIVTNAHAINQGKMPELGEKKSDFFFLPCEQDAQIVRTVVDLVSRRLPKAYGEKIGENIQVISPTRKGEAGTENLNVSLQAVLNPPSPSKKEKQFRETCFRVGDKVMQTRNNYEIEWKTDEPAAPVSALLGEGKGKTGTGIYNGDIGVIEDIDTSESNLVIRFDNRVVQYGFDLLEDLELAYAMTVHKGQGSEYPYVIIPLGNAPRMLLTRNLLYTAVTRARVMVILVGRKETVQTMVQNNRQALRYSNLAFWLTDNK